MEKKKIADEIRWALEGMPCPICTMDYSDEVMVKIHDDVKKQLLLTLGTCDTSIEDVEDAWWREVEEFAVMEYKMPYYEDMD